MRLEEVRALFDDTGLEVPLNELRDALAQLERDGLVRMPRQNTVVIAG